MTDNAVHTTAVGEWVNIKVRFKGERRWWFMSTGGKVSHLRIHAATVGSVEQAKAIAADVITHDDDVVASRVDADGRTVARYGEATPKAADKPVYGPAGGYTYLVGATNAGHPVFHVRDGDDWGTLTAAVYSACHDEARRAGLATGRLNVYGRIALISTRGLVFHQRWDRAA